MERIFKYRISRHRRLDVAVEPPHELNMGKMRIWKNDFLPRGVSIFNRMKLLEQMQFTINLKMERDADPRQTYAHLSPEDRVQEEKNKADDFSEAIYAMSKIYSLMVDGDYAHLFN